ncbi:hypothetical protein [Yoonia sp. 208BN28-4]|uniref:hypothetical protein n=1 Tax=Yoonia sp. 208BN28-4 TaxID=3126505 RepID=UPI0030A0133D
MTFKLVAMVLAAFCVALSVMWFVDVGLYTVTYGVAADTGTQFLGRRMAPILLGLGLMFYLARNAPPSPLRRTMCLGIAVAFAGVATTGIMAFIDGVASFAILIAAGTEFAAALAFIAVSQDREQAG